MSTWNGATAIVTGAASGIGLALSKAMVVRGVKVWLTDIDADRVEEAVVHPAERGRVEALSERLLSPSEAEFAHRQAIVRAQRAGDKG